VSGPDEGDHHQEKDLVATVAPAVDLARPSVGAMPGAQHIALHTAQAASHLTRPGVARHAGVLSGRVTSRHPHDTPRAQPHRAAASRMPALVVALALLLQVVLPALASPASRDAAAATLFGDTLCIGSPAGGSPAASESPEAPPPAPATIRHTCCVLCTSPGLAAAPARPAVHGPAWSRIAAVASVRFRGPLVAAVERNPIRPRAPPVA